MFRSIISRDNGCPWGETGMTTAKWQHVPTQMVRIADLIATQPGVLLHALVDDVLPVGGDPIPHVIDWAGNLYLEDGHHRAVRVLLSGRQELLARVLHVDGEHEQQTITNGLRASISQKPPVIGAFAAVGRGLF